MPRPPDAPVWCGFSLPMVERVSLTSVLTKRRLCPVVPSVFLCEAGGNVLTFLVGGTISLAGGATFPEGGATLPEGGATFPEGGATLPEGGATFPEGGAAFPEGGATLLGFPDEGA